MQVIVTHPPETLAEVEKIRDEFEREVRRVTGIDDAHLSLRSDNRERAIAIDKRIRDLQRLYAQRAAAIMSHSVPQVVVTSD